MLIQVTLIAIATGIITYNFWFSYILLIIIIGGILVLFIYITRVASNEKFRYSNKVTIIIIIAIGIRIIRIFIDPFKRYQLISRTDTIISRKTVIFRFSLNKYLNYPSNWIIILIIIYLLITLIAVVKITNVTYGPLRQKF